MGDSFGMKAVEDCLLQGYGEIKRAPRLTRILSLFLVHCPRCQSERTAPLASDIASQCGVYCGVVTGVSDQDQDPYALERRFGFHAMAGGCTWMGFLSDRMTNPRYSLQFLRLIDGDDDDAVCCLPSNRRLTPA